MRITGQPWKVASSDPSRLELGNVLLDPEHGRAVATDGHVLVSVPLVLDEGEQGESVLLPAQACKAILANGRNGDGGRFQIRKVESTGESFAYWTDPKTGGQSEVRLGKGEDFPPWERCLPGETEGYLEVALNPWLLVRLAEAAGATKDSPVTIRFKGNRPTTAMEVRYKNMASIERAVIMPCRVKDE